jgi:mRNA-degrading endonuclease toxin of MazEF toxin-antitoxin module
MTEQVRTIDRTRLTGVSGAVDEPTLATVRRFLRYHLDR